ncbi:MAG: hypothetical protein WA810_07055 [Maribacter sp.]
MEIHFKSIGVLLMILALVHVIFPKYFHWKEELMKLSLVNRQMMLVHTIFIALGVFLMGLLCLTSTADLIETRLGKSLSLGLALFWSVRLFIQFFGYSPLLWKGKKLETSIHILFSILWTYFSGVFWWNYLN